MKWRRRRPSDAHHHISITVIRIIRLAECSVPRGLSECHRCTFLNRVVADAAPGRCEMCFQILPSIISAKLSPAESSHASRRSGIAHTHADGASDAEGLEAAALRAAAADRGAELAAEEARMTAEVQTQMQLEIARLRDQVCLGPRLRRREVPATVC